MPNCRRPEAEPVALSLPEALYEESAHRRGAVALAAVLLALTVSSLALVSPPAGEWSSHSRHTAVNVEQLLPEDVLFHVTVPSPAAVRQRLSQSLAQQLLSDPALKPLHTHFENNLEQFAADVRQLSGLTLDELLTLPGPVSISLVPRVDRNPSVVACMRFEKLDPEIDRLLNTVRVRCDRGDMEYSVTQSETTRVISITSGGLCKDAVAASWFVRDGLLVISDSYETVGKILRRWDTGPEELPSFADNTAWLSIQSRTSDPDRTPALRWFANVGGLLNVWVNDASLTPEQYAPQRELLQTVLSTASTEVPVTGIGGTVDMATADFDLLVRTAIQYPTARPGILRILSFPPEDQTPPEWVSEHDAYIRLNWDLNQAKELIAERLDSASGEKTTEAWLYQSDTTFRTATGVNILTEIVEQLNGRVCVVQARDSGPLVVGLGMNDPARAAELLDIIMDLPFFLLTSETEHGRRLYRIPAKSMGNSQTAGVAVFDDYMYWSSSWQKLKQIARRTPDSRPLAETRKYGRLASYLPDRTSAVVFGHRDQYVDLLINILMFGPGDGPVPESLSALRQHAVDVYGNRLCLYAVPDNGGAQFVLFSLKKGTP